MQKKRFNTEESGVDQSNRSDPSNSDQIDGMTDL